VISILGAEAQSQTTVCFCPFFRVSQGVCGSLVGESKAAHTGLDAQDVVVDREQLLQGGAGVGLERHGHLGVINAGEVAGAGRLVLLGLQGEGVHVDTGVGHAGVVHIRLVLVEVLAQLLLEAVLTVEDQLELVQHTDLVAEGAGGEVALLDEEDVGNARTGGGAGHVGEQVGRAHHVGQHLLAVGEHGGVDRDVDVRAVGGEVPHGVALGGRGRVGVLVAPHQLLHWVVEGQADQLGGGLRHGRGQGVTAGVLHLLDQVLVTLLGEAATLLRVKVHVVGPHLEGVGAEVIRVVGRQVEIQAHLVVLQGDQGQVQAGVAVEEEQQRQVHLGGGRGGADVQHRRHLAVVDLVRLTQEHLGVQTEPRLVVLVNALATDRQLDGGNRALSHPAHVGVAVRGRQVGRGGRRRLEGNVHVADQVTVAGDRHGHAAGRGGRAVHRLLDVLHREVRVALVHTLEEGHLGLTSQVNVLGTVSYELHQTTSH
jgi:hypothetical protein